MSKRIELIDSLQATIASDNITLSSILEYTNPKDEYEDNEVPNWSAVKAVSTPVLKLLNMSADSAQSITAGIFIMNIFVVQQSGAMTLNIGLTNGGGEILPNTLANTFIPISAQQYFAADGNLYFKVTGSGVVNIYVYYVNNLV